MKKRGLSDKKVIFILVFAVALLSFASAVPHDQYPSFAKAEFSVSGSSVSASDDIIYNKGYYSANGAAWTEFTLQGTPYGDGQPWVLNSGSGSLNLPSQGKHYVIVYSCSLVNNGQSWDCHGGVENGQMVSKWQLHVINNANPDCIPNCQGKVCGSDGCGNNNNCGVCSGSQTCNSNGQCISYEPGEPLNLGAEPTGYPSVDEIYAILRDWSAAEPGMISYEVYGENGGYDLVALRISAVSPYAEQSTPKVLINSCIHGDENIATVSSLIALHRLLSDYGRDGRVTAMFSNRVVYYVPAVDPIRYDNRDREEEGRDPNRSYPHPKNPDNQPTSSVAALIRLFEQKRMNAVLSVHADGRMVLHPWDYTTERFDEDGAGDAHRTVSRNMAEKVGWQWGTGLELLGYPARGTASDFFFIRGRELGFNTLALGLEVGTEQRPPTSEISQEANYMVDILTIFIEQAPVAISYLYSFVLI